MDTATFNIKLQGFEIAEKSMQVTLTNKVEDENPNFNFDINATTNVDEARRIIIIFLTINIKDLNGKSLTGKISVGFGFEVINFEDLPKNESGQYGVPFKLEDSLRGIALSTTRGIMYSEFRGTVLHNAILPIINPNNFRRQKQQEKAEK